jgi:hypothetical protein
LIQGVIAHHNFSGKKPQKPELSVTAKKKSDAIETGKPLPRGNMMGMGFVAEGEPNVDVREKK